ncbi:hypothetical protein EVA_20277 [gut metagenome]|uniref:Uncharacterized protein n=1 Tax=gut metagenome TaxID=749906 RepID=J9F9P3_9ZZZZ
MVYHVAILVYHREDKWQVEAIVYEFRFQVVVELLEIYTLFNRL